MNMKTALIPALVLSALALQACGNGEAKVPEEEKEIPTIPVEVAEVRMGAVTALYSTTATLEAEREARVRDERREHGHGFAFVRGPERLAPQPALARRTSRDLVEHVVGHGGRHGGKRTRALAAVASRSTVQTG